MKKISVAAPYLVGNEKKYVVDCLESNWISSIGFYISEFEKNFAEYLGVKHAISTNNGTTALHVALVALGLQPGDEVIIPTVTYIATANAVTYCGATPVLVDVEPHTLNILTSDIESKITPRTAGIIPVHLYGQPAAMDEIQEIAKKHNLWVLEDAAEAHGAAVNQKKVGSIGDCAIFSFFGNKIMTTGEGGMVTTNDDKIAERVRLLKGQGMDPKRRYWFPEVGYNYRMTNIQAAIGLAQLENLDKSISARAELATWYNEALKDLGSLILPKDVSGTQNVFWMYNVFLKDGDENQRDRLMAKLDSVGIETRPVFYPMHVMPPYAEDRSFPNADSWAYRGINLPTHQAITPEDVDFIAHSMVAFFEEL